MKLCITHPRHPTSLIHDHARQTAVIAYLKSEELLLFSYSWRCIELATNNDCSLNCVGSEVLSLFSSRSGNLNGAHPPNVQRGDNARETPEISRIVKHENAITVCKYRLGLRWVCCLNVASSDPTLVEYRPSVYDAGPIFN